MQRLSCPHCGFRNAAAQNFCSRCEQSLHEAPEAAEAAGEELKTEVDLRLSDLMLGEPAQRATGPTDLHANLAVRGPHGPGAELPLTERPTAPWPEGQSATSHAAEPSRTTVEPWAQATALLSPEEHRPPAENWRTRGREKAAQSAPEAQPRIVQRPRAQPAPAPAPARARQATPEPAPASARTAGPPAGTRKLATRERLREVARGEAAPAPAASVAAADGRGSKEAAWPTPQRQLCAVGIDLFVWVGGSMALLSLLIALAPRAAWPAERPTLLEALAMWLAHSGRAPLLWLLGSAALAALYSLWGAASGRTVGRLLCGLKLVDARGHIPGVGAGMWHILGGALGVGALGAGLLWPIVDPAARTWASLTSRTYVIRA